MHKSKRTLEKMP